MLFGISKSSLLNFDAKTGVLIFAVVAFAATEAVTVADIVLITIISESSVKSSRPNLLGFWLLFMPDVFLETEIIFLLFFFFFFSCTCCPFDATLTQQLPWSSSLLLESASSEELSEEELFSPLLLLLSLFWHALLLEYIVVTSGSLKSEMSLMVDFFKCWVGFVLIKYR